MLKFPDGFKIKRVFCNNYVSFAITSDGQVFSWGPNQFSNLGYKSVINIFAPRLIENFKGIKTVCALATISYFLTDHGELYYCGQSQDNNGLYFIRDTPFLFKLDKMPLYEKMQLFISNRQRYYWVVAYSNGNVHRIIPGGGIYFSPFKTFCEFSFKEEHIKLTPCTINIDDFFENDYTTKAEFKGMCLNFISEIFEKIKQLSDGR